MINRCLKRMSKYNRVWMVYSLFICHNCTRWSHLILAFLTFHEIDFATNVPSVLFTRTILGVDFINWCHCITDLIVYTYAEFGMNCLKKKWDNTHCSKCCVGSLLQYIMTIHLYITYSCSLMSGASLLRPVKLNKEWELICQ